LAVPAHTESSATQAQTILRDDTNDANSQLTPSLDRKEVLTSTKSTPRVVFAMSLSKKLEDFFLINGIGADRAEQIIQDLIDADHYLISKGNALLERRLAENTELIERGETVRISRTAEEKAEIGAERETLHRQVFGEYYDAYGLYDRSYPQRSVVGTFSSSLSGPLEYTAREAIVKIMYEENSRFVSELKRETAESGVLVTSTPQARAADKGKNDLQLLAKRSFNNRVMDRAKAYLSTSEREQFKRLLDNDVRRLELTMEMMELEPAR
jgi:hypothetical protein